MLPWNSFQEAPIKKISNNILTFEKKKKDQKKSHAFLECEWLTG